MKKVLNIVELNKYYNAGVLICIIGIITLSFGVVIGLIPLMDEFGHFLSQVGFRILNVSMLVIALARIMSEKIASGICIALFGSLTLGIWPLIVVYNEKKRLSALRKEGIETLELDVKVESLRSGYNAGMIVAIVGISTLIFLVGIFVIIAAVIIVSIQLIREKKIVHGVCMYIFGILTFGIWPLVVAIQSKKRLKGVIDSASNDFSKSEVKYSYSPESSDTNIDNKGSIVTPIYKTNEIDTQQVNVQDETNVNNQANVYGETKNNNVDESQISDEENIMVNNGSEHLVQDNLEDDINVSESTQTADETNLNEKMVEEAKKQPTYEEIEAEVIVENKNSFDNFSSKL